MARASDLQALAAALLAVVAAALVVALVVHHASALGAAVGAALAVVAAFASWKPSGRPLLAASVGLGLATWPLPTIVPIQFVAAALAPAALLLVPLPGRIVGAAAAAATAFFAAFLTLEDPLVALFAFVLAGVATLARPILRTVGGLHALRDVALFAPAPLLTGALFLNAVTRRAEPLPPGDAVLLGVALASLLALGSAALLGVTLLLQSTDSNPGPAWASVCVVGATFVASLPSTDPDLVLPLFVLAAAPLFVLASLAAARWATVAPRFRYIAWSLPFLLGVAQWGLRA